MHQSRWASVVLCSCSEESRNLWELGEWEALFSICSPKQMCLVPFGAHLEPVSGVPVTVWSFWG